MSFVIRQAQLSDLSCLNELIYNSASYWGYDSEKMKKYMDAYGIKKEYLAKYPIYMVFDNKQIIGCYSFSDHKIDGWELNYFFIVRDYIGKGYGKKQWQACIETARALKIKSFVFWSDRHAEDFYCKMGAKKIGSRPSTITPQVMVPLMQYQVSS